LLDATISVRDQLRTALEAVGAKLYIDERIEPEDKPVRIPHGWFWSTTESDSAPDRIFGRLEDIVTLQLYARSQRGLANLEDAVEFLDDYWAPDYGNALSVHYIMQSKTRTSEGEGLWSCNILYAVRYTDARKFA
jgi:hypothetical protein